MAAKRHAFHKQYRLGLVRRFYCSFLDGEHRSGLLSWQWRMHSERRLRLYLGLLSLSRLLYLLRSWIGDGLEGRQEFSER